VSPDGVIVPQLWQLLITGYNIQPPHAITAKILLPYPSWLQALGAIMADAGILSAVQQTKTVATTLTADTEASCIKVTSQTALTHRLPAGRLTQAGGGVPSHPKKLLTSISAGSLCC